MAPVAPLVAGHWPRRLGGLPGPFSAPAGSGESPNGQPIQVELFVDGLWVDITSYVMTRDGSYRINITRGQPNESSGTEPSRCTMQLNNRDGRFSPRNPTSPCYGKLGRNQPLRVSVPSGNDKSYRFWGEVASWPQNWDITGVDVWVELEAAGLLRRMQQGSAPIGSTLYLALASGTLANPIRAYWPCEDASDATSIASATDGVQNMVISGAPTLASNSGFVCSNPLPVMNTTGTFTGTIPAYPTPVATMIRFLLALPSGGATTGQLLCSATGTGSIKRWEIYYTTTGGGSVGLRGRDATGTSVLDITSGADALDGQLAQISAELVQNGSNIDCVLYTMIAGSPSAGGINGTATSQTVGVLNGLAVSGAQAATTIGHVRVQTSTVAPDDIFDLPFQLTAYAGDSAADRIGRLCREAGIPFHLAGDSRDTVTVGAQSNSSRLALITEAVLADGGILYERLDTLGLTYRTRVSLENQAAGLALSYSGNQLSEVPKPVDDDQYTRNDIVVSRSRGSSARATQTDGPMSVLDPPSGVGRYDDSVTLNLYTDDDLADQAGWRLHLGTVNEARYPQISINLAHPTFTGSTTLPIQALGIGMGDRIAISGMPSWSPDDVSQLCLGTSEAIDQFQHRITYNCRPESPFRTGVLDDATLGRLDTGGSALAVAAGPSDTTLTVSVTSGPLWTTSAGDFPFDAVVAGERVTVTNISGASSPQTFTVTRSVNGVSKTLPVGSDVRLYQPLILAL